MCTTCTVVKCTPIHHQSEWVCRVWWLALNHYNAKRPQRRLSNPWTAFPSQARLERAKVQWPLLRPLPCVLARTDSTHSVPGLVRKKSSALVQLVLEHQVWLALHLVLAHHRAFHDAQSTFLLWNLPMLRAKSRFSPFDERYSRITLWGWGKISS